MPIQIHLLQGGGRIKMCLSERTARGKKLPEIGLRLCGACNLTYDRDDLVRRLAVPENRRVRIGSPEDLPAAVEQLRRMIRM